ncbi:plastocyanin/azurin family copper-binding protein [Massilia jejuensis]|uniref:Plastocyanin/azurin family copper-binding protein n=1 Tax=Massilia jejuensis TaxID=648894 RepID=A0ABW0PIZ3_9BURK
MKLPARAAATAVLGLALHAPACAAVHTIVIEGLRFVPQTLEVERGDTVVWRNKDPFPHNARADKGGPASPDIAAGAAWTFRAAKRGRHAYLCTLHRTMTGVLVVK